MVIRKNYMQAMYCISTTRKWYKAKLAYYTQKRCFKTSTSPINGTRQETLKTDIGRIFKPIIDIRKSTHIPHYWYMPLNVKNGGLL